MRKGAYGAGILMGDKFRATVNAANTETEAIFLDSIFHHLQSLYSAGY